MFLIEVFHYYRFKEKVLKKLNYCQLFLQVISLLDIVDGSGIHIYELAYIEMKNHSRKSKYNWLAQENPGKASWYL